MNESVSRSEQSNSPQVIDSEESLDPWSSVVLVGECGLDGKFRGAPRAYVEIDAYEAINLVEALKCVIDTGDWYCQMRAKLERLLADDRIRNRMQGPNRRAEDMVRTPEGYSK